MTKTVVDLNGMMAEVREVNRANGWFDEDRTLDDEVALLHSEVSEMLEAYRSWGMEDATSATCLNEGTHVCKPEGVGSEVADVLIRWLDLSHRHDMSPAVAYANAVEMSWTISSLTSWVNLLHRGVGDLLQPGREVPRWGAYVVVLSLLLVGSEEFDIDLWAEYERKVAYNRTRGHRHGGKRL